MPITVFTKGASVGRYALLNGARRPDAYRFERDSSRADIHKLHFPKVEDFNKIAEDLFSAPGNPPLYFTITPEPEWSEGETLKKLETLQADQATALGLKDERIKALELELQEAKTKIESLGDKSGGITDEQMEALRERDAMLEALMKHGGETIGDRLPLQYLTDVLFPAAKPEAETPKKSIAAKKPAKTKASTASN